MYNYRLNAQALYKLKQFFGKVVTLIIKQGKTIDNATGVVTVNEESYQISVIVAPPKCFRKADMYNLSGVPETNVDLLLLIDYVDIPSITAGIENWVFIIDGFSYTTVSAEPIQVGAPALIKLARTETMNATNT